jgi:hypothetical protein
MVRLVIICWQCDGSGRVCESHPKRPWEGEHACGCGAAGMRCPICNPGDGLTAPRMPTGFVDDGNGGTRH